MSLQTNNSKKSIFPLVDKRFWPTSSRIIECDKPQGTIYKGPKGMLTNSAEVLRSLLQDL